MLYGIVEKQQSCHYCHVTEIIQHIYLLGFVIMLFMSGNDFLFVYIITYGTCLLSCFSFIWQF